MINPVTIEQSILSFLSILDTRRVMNVALEVIQELAERGEIRRTDDELVDSLYRTADNKYQITYVWTKYGIIGTELYVYLHKLTPTIKLMMKRKSTTYGFEDRGMELAKKDIMDETGNRNVTFCTKKVLDIGNLSLTPDLVKGLRLNPHDKLL